MSEEIMLALEQNQGHASAMKDAQIKSYDFVKKKPLRSGFFILKNSITFSFF